MKEELEENLDLCEIFVMMRRTLVMILLTKNLSFDPKRKDAAIELHLSRLEKEISSLDYKVGYSNLTNGERDAVYSLKIDNIIIIKVADKGLQLLSGTERATLKR